MTRQNAPLDHAPRRDSLSTPAAALLGALALLATACGGAEGADAGLASASAASSGSSSYDAGPGVTFAAAPGGAIQATVTLTFDARRSTPVYVSFPRAVLAGPGIVYVAKGSRTATFLLHANPYLAADALVTVSARTQSPDPNTVVAGSLAIGAGALAGAAKPEVLEVRFSPSTVAAGGSTIATLTLGAPAPEGGAVVSLSNPNDVFGQVAKVPATVTVPAGSTSVQFTVATGSTTYVNTLPIGGSSFGGAFAGAWLTVVP